MLRQADTSMQSRQNFRGSNTDIHVVNLFCLVEVLHPSQQLWSCQEVSSPNHSFFSFTSLTNAQVTHSRITSPVLLRIKSHG